VIPGFVIAIITFPGVIVHEVAHQLFCRWLGVAVFDVCYFRFGNPSGYVIHEKPRSAGKSLLISIGPFLVNTVLGAVVSLPAAIPVIQFGAGSPLDYVLIWLGVSIAAHAFPSTGDARSMWAAAWSPGSSAFARIAAVPLVALIYLGALGSVFWLDVIYGVGVAVVVPYLVVGALA
jgi:hypothetical protein